ncbi:hypothetical protein STXM2123_2793 [Streptomyces sp. F-3]|nr:hypothetical protein STXM2123_2793 [Streptomyces sp. F-3]
MSRAAPPPGRGLPVRRARSAIPSLRAGSGTYREGLRTVSIANGARGKGN